MTQPSASDVAAPWAIEIERDQGRPEYVAAEAIEVDGESITIYTVDGHEVTLRRDDVKKLLLMRTLATATSK